MFFHLLLEDELPKKPEDLPSQPLSRRTSNHGQSRRPSFSGAKRIMENLGILSPRSPSPHNEIPEVPSQAAAGGAGPLPPGPILPNSPGGGDNVSELPGPSNAAPLKKRTSLKFKFGFGRSTEKEAAVPRTLPAAAHSHPPASTSAGPNSQIVRPSENAGDVVQELENILLHQDNNE